jgi:O-antigen/teichoic acid export membrane protein
MSDSHHSRLRWSFLSTFTTAGMQLIASVTITRFLEPRDYGLAAMASLCYMLAGYVTQLGMGRAVVQKPGLTDGNIRAAFSLSFLTGIGGFAILAALSPAIGRYFREPRLPLIVVAFGLNLVFNSLSTVPGGLLRREFRMRDLAICDFLSYLLSTFCIGLPMAIKGYGVWALVGSNVSQPLIEAITYFIARPHSIAPTLHREDYRHITSFSGKATATTAAEALGNSLDTLLMGRIVSPAALGLYNRAQTLSSVPGYNISTGLTRVFHPTIARAAEKGTRECYGILLQSERQLMSLIIPLCVGAAVAAPTIIPAIFGKQWIPGVPVYQVLCIAALFDASFHLPSIQLEILSRFRHRFILQIVFGVCFGAGILAVAPRGGVIAVATLLAVLQAARSILLHQMCARSLDVSAVSIVGSWVPGLVSAAVIGITLAALQNYLPGFSAWNAFIKLTALILLSASIFFAIYRTFYRDSVYASWRLLFKRGS